MPLLISYDKRNILCYRKVVMLGIKSNVRRISNNGLIIATQKGYVQPADIFYLAKDAMQLDKKIRIRKSDYINISAMS